MATSQRRSRFRLAGRFDLMTGPFSGTQRSPSQNMRRALLSATRLAPKSSVALRPRLATGVPFRGGRPDERGQPRVHVRRIRRIRFAIRSAYRHLVLDPQAKGYELPIRTPLDVR